MDPHAPYIPPGKVADFTHATPIEIELDRVVWHTRLPGVSDGEEYVDRYDEEIAYTDSHIGRLLAVYEYLGLIENTIVVLTADHGETMIEHDRYFAHCFNVWDAVMQIPLAVRRPGIRGRRSGVPVSNVDVVPSLLEYVGLAAPDDLDGKPFAQRTDTDRIYLEAEFETKYNGHTRGVVEGTKKWGVLVRRAKIVDRWFYDLQADPNETEVREWQAGESGRALLARVGRELGKHLPSERLDQRTDLDAEELEALHELGYLE
jgi:arylsulfatase A-like enzyme